MITTLQSLRFIAAIAIFLSHLQFFPERYRWVYDTYFYYLFIGVSYFFMLSGFVLTRRYYQKFMHPDPSLLWSYYRKRIVAIIPLHLLTFLISLPVTSASSFTLSDISVNFLLLQTLFPDQVNCSCFNVLSWFLADLLMFYLLFPFIVRFMTVIPGNLIRKILLLGIFLTALASVYFVLLRSSPDVKWAFYRSPYIRFFEFFSGILLGLLPLPTGDHARNISSRIFGTFFELSVIFVLLLFLGNAPGIPPQLSFSLYFIPPIALIVIVYSRSRGLISSLLSWRPLVSLGNISFPFLMFHWLYIRYATTFFMTILSTYPGQSAVFLFVLSLVSGIIYRIISIRVGRFIRNVSINPAILNRTAR